MGDVRNVGLTDLPGPSSQAELEDGKASYEEYCKKLFAPKREFEKPESLKGVRWMSCTMYIFTPHAVANLAELGAEVIKIETPRAGEPMRHTSPFNEAYLYPMHDSRPGTGTGFGYMNANPNKYNITLDYHRPEAQEVFKRLVTISDGLTECYRPGTFDKWKQSYRYVQEINPRFIYVWGGGFGYGPKTFGASYDILGQAHAGLASTTGWHEDFGGHPAKHTNWIIDWYSGTQITVAVLAALNWRRKTGLGTMIELSQVQCATRTLGYGVPMYGRFGIVRQRWGNWDTQLCVHGIVLCGKSDYPDDRNPQLKHDARYVAVSAFNDADFQELCAVIGRKDLYDKYKSHKERLHELAQMDIYKTLEEWAADKSRSQVAKALTEAGLLAMPVMNDKEVYESEHFRARGTVRWQEDPTFGDIVVQGGYSTGLMSETPRRVKWIWRMLGADNMKIYHELLGYPVSQLEDWYAKGII
ncbi:MAG: CoA transferase [Peptococcaceae bacterium]|nr:CoA transferase [Peptococcaceae bacterium]